MLKFVNEVYSSHGMLQGAIVIVSTVLFSIAFKISRIIDFFDTRKKSRINFLSEAINHTNVNDLMKSKLEVEVQKEFFRLLSSVSAGERHRALIFDICHKSGGKIQIFDFKKIANYLKFSENKVDIEISKMDYLGVGIMTFLAIFYLICAGVFILGSIYLKSNILKAFVLLCVGILFIIACVFFASPLNNLKLAKEVKEILKTSSSDT